MKLFAGPVAAGVMHGLPSCRTASESIASSVPAFGIVSSKPASGPPAALSAASMQTEYDVAGRSRSKR